MIDQRCTYCDRPALAPGHVTPPLCAQHCEIVRIVLRLREQGQPVTIDAIERLYASGIVITRFVAPEDLPDRLIEYLDGELRQRDEREHTPAIDPGVIRRHCLIVTLGE